ncbi:prestin-like [Amphiura filiformis]|uniref:prestin-like n=1 Tax=Amphiura filiformis TaxID=82378 RepID=UPI003B224CC4
MRIPQAMAYAILATLPAVYGLYVAFFTVLVYAIFGTSKHISIGTWSIASIMTGGAIDEIIAKEEESKPTSDTQLRVQIAISLCLLVGIIQAAMGILKLGIVTVYLSEPLVRGFTTGAAVHVFTSQFPKLFGITVTRYNGVFAFVYTYVEFFSILSTANPTAIIISVLSLILLASIGEINELQANKGWLRKDGEKGKKLPLPSELVVVIISTAASYLANFESKYNLPVVGDVPTGLPRPIVPSTKYFGDLIGNAFAIAIVNFAISISLAQTYAKKHNYEVDSNQELIAIGNSHIVGSFFLCFPHAAAMSKTAVQEGSGGRTQLASIVSSLVVLIILLWLGPLLTQLPECVLASIIVIALRGMFRQFKDLLMLWKASLVDFLLWFVTFLLVVLLGVDLGLLLGVLFALVTIIVRSQRPYCALMGRIPKTEIYRDISHIHGIDELSGIKIFQSSSSLSFINAEHFKKTLYKMVGINPQEVLITRNAIKLNENKKASERSILTSSLFSKYTSLSEDTEDPTLSRTLPQNVHTVIIECGMFTYVDVVGVKTLQTIATDFEKVDIRVVFAGCKASVRNALLTITSINQSGEIGLDRMYVSVHDAVLSCRRPSIVSESSVELAESTMSS